MLPFNKIAIIVIDCDLRGDDVWSFHRIGHHLVLILCRVSSIDSCVIPHSIIVLNYSLLKIIQMLLIQDTFELLCFLLWVLDVDHVNGADDIRKLPGVSGVLVLGYWS